MNFFVRNRGSRSSIAERIRARSTLRILALTAVAVVLITACPNGVGPTVDPSPTTGFGDEAALSPVQPPVVTPLGPLVARDDNDEHSVVYAFAVHSLLSGETENPAGIRIDWIDRLGPVDDQFASFRTTYNTEVRLPFATFLDLPRHPPWADWDRDDTVQIHGDPTKAIATPGGPASSLIAVNSSRRDTAEDGTHRVVAARPTALIIGLAAGERVELRHAEWDPSIPTNAALDENRIALLSEPVTIEVPEYDEGDLVNEGDHSAFFNVKQQYQGPVRYADAEETQLVRGEAIVVSNEFLDEDSFIADGYVYIDHAGPIVRARRQIVIPNTATSGYLLYEDTEVGVRRVIRVSFADKDDSFDSQSPAVGTWYGSKGDTLTISDDGKAVSRRPDNGVSYFTQLDSTLSSVKGGVSFALLAGNHVLTAAGPSEISATYTRAPHADASVSGTARNVSSGATSASLHTSAVVRPMISERTLIGTVAGIEVIVSALGNPDIVTDLDETSGRIDIQGANVGDIVLFQPIITSGDGTVSVQPSTTVVVDESQAEIGSVFVTDLDYQFKARLLPDRDVFATSFEDESPYWFEDETYRAALVIENSGYSAAPPASVSLSGVGLSVSPSVLTVATIPAGGSSAYTVNITYTGEDIPGAEFTDATLLISTVDSQVGEWADSARARFYAAEDRRFVSLRGRDFTTTFLDATGRRTTMGSRTAQVPTSVMPIDIAITGANEIEAGENYDIWYTSEATDWQSPIAEGDEGRIVDEVSPDDTPATATVLTLDAGAATRGFLDAGDVDYYRLEE